MDGIFSLLSGESARVAGMALALVASGAGAGALPAALGQTEADPGEDCAIMAPLVEASPWVRAELFFGTAKPDGSAVSDAEWDAFLDAEITPRFPEGLTVLEGAGQWQEADGAIVEERSKVVVLLYPREAVAESNAEIKAIRTAYELAFQQDSVLRADDDRPVCASF